MWSMCRRGSSYSSWVLESKLLLGFRLVFLITNSQLFSSIWKDRVPAGCMKKKSEFIWWQQASFVLSGSDTVLWAGGALCFLTLFSSQNQDLSTLPPIILLLISTTPKQATVPNLLLQCYLAPLLLGLRGEIWVLFMHVIGAERDSMMLTTWNFRQL